MARITSEVASRALGNQYDLILVASRRVRELRGGHAATIAHTHKNEIITALREIEQGTIGREYLLKNPNLEKDTRKRTK